MKISDRGGTAGKPLKAMKSILFYLCLFFAAACGKDVDAPQACGYVFDKIYKSPPGDTSGPLRTYWLWMASDTVILPPPAPPITHWQIQVPKRVYDTMLVPGQRYPPRYCY